MFVVNGKCTERIETSIAMELIMRYRFGHVQLIIEVYQ